MHNKYGAGLSRVEQRQIEVFQALVPTSLTEAGLHGLHRRLLHCVEVTPGLEDRLQVHV